MPGFGQRRHDVVGEAAALPVDQFLGARGDQRQLLRRGQAVRAGDREAHVAAPLQPGDPHHVELVEVGGEDGQELRPLQQSLALSSASASTRALKSSQLSSRLENRSSGSGSLLDRRSPAPTSDDPPWNGSIGRFLDDQLGRRTCRCRRRRRDAAGHLRPARSRGAARAACRRSYRRSTWNLCWQSPGHSPVRGARNATPRGEQQVSARSGARPVAARRAVPWPRP